MFPEDPIVIIGGVRYVCKPEQETKTNAEVAERIFTRRMDDGVVEYSSGELYAKVKVVSVSRTGNRITVVFDAGQ